MLHQIPPGSGINITNNTSATPPPPLHREREKKREKEWERIMSHLQAMQWICIIQTESDSGSVHTACVLNKVVLPGRCIYESDPTGATAEFDYHKPHECCIWCDREVNQKTRTKHDFSNQCLPPSLCWLLHSYSEKNDCQANRHQLTDTFVISSEHGKQCKSHF